MAVGRLKAAGRVGTAGDVSGRGEDAGGALAATAGGERVHELCFLLGGGAAGTELAEVEWLEAYGDTRSVGGDTAVCWRSCARAEVRRGGLGTGRAEVAALGARAGALVAGGEGVVVLEYRAGWFQGRDTLSHGGGSGVQGLLDGGLGRGWEESGLPFLGC